MNADIRIYPSEELSHLDMAELMDASLLRDGILQGCALSIVSHELTIASGRLIIKGRLGVVTAGQIDRPTVTATQTCQVCAICDLTAENPFTIEMLTQGGYENLMARANNYTDETFNIDSGVHVFKLGTCTVDPSVGVTAVTPISNSNRSAKNRALINTMQSTLTTLQNNLTTLTTRVSTLITRLRATSSDRQYVRTYTTSSFEYTVKNFAANTTHSFTIDSGGTGTIDLTGTSAQTGAVMPSNASAVAIARITVSNSNIVLQGYNIDGDGQGSIKLRNISNSAISSFTLSGKLILLLRDPLLPSSVPIP